MRWKVKSLIQNVIASLPTSASYTAYYWMQKNFGGLRNVNPMAHFTDSIKIWQSIKKQGLNPVDKVFFEVGTGRVPIIPIAYWLMGAQKVITVDLNPYLKEELLLKALDFMQANQREVKLLFGDLLDLKRFQALVDFTTVSFDLDSCLKLLEIKYLSPCDASSTDLESQSVDIHTSYTVLEHIPFEDVKNILFEGNRIVKEDGLFVHVVDYSDHFSHSDPNISGINFLKFSDSEWEKYAANRYMYMNRLRHDDFLELFKSVNHRVVDIKVVYDERARKLLEQNQLKLNSRFLDKDIDTLSISSAWIVSTKNSAG